MTERTNLDQAQKAQAVLDAPAFKDAFDAVRNSIINGIENCPSDNVELAEQLRLSLKLLKALRANLEGAVNSGKIEKYRLDQDTERKKNPLRNLFR